MLVLATARARARMASSRLWRVTVAGFVIHAGPDDLPLVIPHKTGVFPLVAIAALLSRAA